VDDNGVATIPAQPSDLKPLLDMPASLPPTRKKPRRILHVGMPTRGHISPATFAWALQLETARIVLGIGGIRYWCIPFKGIAEARTRVVELVIEYVKAEPEAEHWVLWIDDDMGPDAWAINQLYCTMVARPEIGIISGYMCRKQDSDPGMLQSVENGDWSLPGRDFKIGDVVESLWCPTGFMLHRGEWLHKLHQPWFKTNESGVAGEDSWFTAQAKRQLGMRCFVHTGCVIPHWSIEEKRAYLPYMAPPVVEIPQEKQDTMSMPHAEMPAEPTPDLAIPVADGEPVCAFLNCDNPMLAERMLVQLKDAPSIAILDNGGRLSLAFDDRMEQVAPDTKYAVIATPQNLRWGGGVNYLMAQIIKHYPECKAVWACNDDIEGASHAMARKLYDTLMATGAAVLSPCVNSSSWSQFMHEQYTGGLRKVTYVDFTAPMISVEAWKKVGPLDVEGIGVGWGCDIDWNVRARKLGYELYVDDTLKIDHPSAGTTCLAQGTLEEHNASDWCRALIEKYGKAANELVSGSY
jgi:GT2 family glycosyltransferase